MSARARARFFNTTTQAQAASVTYDNRNSALGSDANGIPTLTLHGSATRVWYHPTAGNNSNAGTSVTGIATSAMKATIGGASGAWQALRNGFGDHLMVPAGVTVTELLTSLATRTGLSTSYPIVWTTYDPSDPTNSALWRTGEFHLTGTGGSGECVRFPNGTSKVVIEGTHFVQPQVGSGNLFVFDGVGLGTGTQDYDLSVMFHRCRFEGTQITIQYTGDEFPTTKYYLKNFVFRHCLFFRSPGQGIYCVWQDGYTVEDCVFWHNGWGGGADTRTGATIPGVQYNHNVYHDCEGLNTLYRRCVFAEGSLHGLMLRCGGQVDDCIFLENALAVLAGGGVGCNKHRPSGVAFQSTGVVAFNGLDCNTNTSTLNGGALNSQNCTNGSFYTDFIVGHSNVQAPGYNRFAALMHVRNADGHTANPLENEFDPTGPAPADSYMLYSNGIVRAWPPGSGYAGVGAHMADIQQTSELAQCHLTATNNVWEDDSQIISGTYGSGNTSPVSGVPNSNYDTDDLVLDLSFGSKAAMYGALVADTAATTRHWAREMSNLSRAAYGKSARF